MKTDSNAASPSAAGDESISSTRSSDGLLPEASVSRRGFLGGVGGLAASAGAIGVAGAALGSPAEAGYTDPQTTGVRRRRALNLRTRAALDQARVVYPDHQCNDDEDIYGDFRNQYSKALPHDPVLGEVDTSAYLALLSAIESGAFADYEAVPLAGARKLACPLGALAFEMVGPDSHHVTIPPAPAFNSAWQAGEMVEVYWKSLLRDVPFADYGVNADVATAASDMSLLSDFRGPKSGGLVTSDTLFRAP